MKMVVTGHTGQLVSCLVERAPAFGIEVLPVGRPKLDLIDVKAGLHHIEQLGPDIIVSAAAFTAVDKAEADTKIAQVINGRAPGLLAEFADSQDIPIIQISTDYVFDGNKTLPYVECDPMNPLGVYGASKLEGEQAVMAATPNHVILRTAWVYSPFGNNFVRTMLRLARERSVLQVVADQHGNPTSALDLADAVITVGRNLLAQPKNAGLRGIFHAAGTGDTNWAAFARDIMSMSKDLGSPSARIQPITSAEYPTLARRPTNSRLDSSKLERHHGVTLPPWQTSTRNIVSRLLLGLSDSVAN